MTLSVPSPAIGSSPSPLADPEPRYPFDADFVSVLGHKIHYVSFGSGDPVLFVHGNPTSSYMWRNVLPRVARETGRRGIALDLLGYGKSDKPKDVRYSLNLHADVIRGFVDAVGLSNIVLVADDWGGPLAMRDVVQRQNLYRGAILFETFLWTFTFQDDFEPKFRMPFRMMRGPLGFWFVQVFNLMMRKLIPEHCPITEEGMRYYLQSVPTVRSRRAMLELVRLNPVDGKPRESVEYMERLRSRLPELQIPVTWLKATPGVVPSDDYPLSLRRLEDLRRRLSTLEIRSFGPGHHFLAEENPQRLADLIVQSIRDRVK